MDIGVSKVEANNIETTQLFNLIAFVSGLITIFMALIGYYLGYPAIYHFYLLPFIALIYFSVLVFNTFGLTRISWLVICLGSPLWQGLVNLMIGGNFSQSAAFLVALAIGYTAFDKEPKTRNIILFLQLLIYSILIIVKLSCGTIFGEVDVIFNFVNERRLLVRDLQMKNKELTHLTEELERFSYIASHDLKSPLRTIINFIGLIEKDLDENRVGNLHEKLDFVKSGAQQMNYLVRDILELSLLKGDEVKSRSLVDLNSVFKKVITNLSEEISELDAEVTSSQLPEYYCSEMEILLLFQNLIQNGIKYNKNSKPKVHVQHQTDKGDLILKFVDNGIGIDQAYHNDIFKFFKRLHTSKEYHGTGLGLGLCKKIVDTYNGDLSVESTVGQGSIFILRLPLINPTKM